MIRYSMQVPETRVRRRVLGPVTDHGSDETVAGKMGGTSRSVRKKAWIACCGWRERLG